MHFFSQRVAFQKERGPGGAGGSEGGGGTGGEGGAGEGEGNSNNNDSKAAPQNLNDPTPENLFNNLLNNSTGANREYLEGLDAAARQRVGERLQEMYFAAQAEQRRLNGPQIGGVHRCDLPPAQRAFNAVYDNLTPAQQAVFDSQLHEENERRAERGLAAIPVPPQYLNNYRRFLETYARVDMGYTANLVDPSSPINVNNIILAAGGAAAGGLANRGNFGPNTYVRVGPPGESRLVPFDAFTISGAGRLPVVPEGYGMGKGIAGRHPALLIDGEVYVHHHHLGAQQLSGRSPKAGDLYGMVTLDACGNVIDFHWVPNN